MSIESATRFLDAVTDDEVLRHQFDYAQTPEDFLSLAQEMGFSFTTRELAQVVLDSSTGVEIRRSTGVWKWLRQMKWVTREHFAGMEPPVKAEN
jgi:predicted ribosomally synthesized peptide with nif11-like leader